MSLLHIQVALSHVTLTYTSGTQSCLSHIYEYGIYIWITWLSATCMYMSDICERHLHIYNWVTYVSATYIYITECCLHMYEGHDCVPLVYVYEWHDWVLLVCIWVTWLSATYIWIVWLSAACISMRDMTVCHLYMYMNDMTGCYLYVYEWHMWAPLTYE